MPVGRIPHSEKIRDLREQKGWSQQDLADKAGVHSKTVSSMENGGPNMLSHIAYVAEALGVECGAVLNHLTQDEPAAASPPLEPSSRRLRLKLRFEVLIEGVAEARDFLDEFDKTFAAKYPVIVSDIDGGSLIVSLEMAYDDLPQLLYQFCQGDFDQFDLKKIIFPEMATDDALLAIMATRLRLGLPLWPDLPKLDPKAGSDERLAILAERISQGLPLWTKEELDDYESVHGRSPESGKQDDVSRELKPADPHPDMATILDYLKQRTPSLWNPISKFDGLQQRFELPNAAVEFWADGSVKVVRVQWQSSPLAVH